MSRSVGFHSSVLSLHWWVLLIPGGVGSRRTVGRVDVAEGEIRRWKMGVGMPMVLPSLAAELNEHRSSSTNVDSAPRICVNRALNKIWTLPLKSSEHSRGNAPPLLCQRGGCGPLVFVVFASARRLAGRRGHSAGCTGFFQPKKQVRLCT